MLNIPSFSTSIIATSALLFSMNVTAFTSEKLLLTPALPVTLASTASAIPHCIADSAISADALSGTRDNGPFSIHTKHIPRQSAKGFGGGTIHYPTDASGCGLLGAIGWSMGGGGALKLATERSTLRAIMPLAPYYDKSYGEVKTPTLVITCEDERIAENKKYANAFYKNTIAPKMKVEVNNGSHFCPSYCFNEILLSKPGIAWMQRYINNDARFDKFLCANENYSKNPRISAYDYKNCL